MEVTIKNIEYLDTVDQEGETPLGVPVTNQVAVDSFAVVFSMDGIEDQSLWFKPEAISNRGVGYGLGDDLHAIEALVREVVFSWSDLNPQGASRSQINGGVDDRVSVIWASGVQEMASSLLANHASRLSAARKSFGESMSALRPDDEVASEIANYLTTNPHENEVGQIAEAISTPETQIVEVMNNYLVTDGNPERVPEGQGGGWLPEEIAAQYREVIS